MFGNAFGIRTRPRTQNLKATSFHCAVTTANRLDGASLADAAHHFAQRLARHPRPPTATHPLCAGREASVVVCSSTLTHGGSPALAHVELLLVNSYGPCHHTDDACRMPPKLNPVWEDALTFSSPGLRCLAVCLFCGSPERAVINCQDYINGFLQYILFSCSIAFLNSSPSSLTHTLTLHCRLSVDQSTQESFVTSIYLPSTLLSTPNNTVKMKYSIMALPAIAAAVSAQDLYVLTQVADPKQENKSLTSPSSNSILQVLQTALPSSLVSEALTNSAAVESEIASQFAAGETPGWFSALPTDVQGYLNPTDAAGVSSLLGASSTLSSVAANLTSSPVTAAPTVLGTGTLLPGGSNGTVISGGNGTAIGGGNNTSLSTSASLSASTTSNGGADETGSSTSSGADASSTDDSADSGASIVTGMLGMSLAGAVGVVGVLAL